MGCRATGKKVTAVALFSNFRKILNKNGAIMSRKLADLFRFIGNYRYYRRSGYGFKAAWIVATMTLPY